MKSAFNTILAAYTAAFISVIPYIILMASIILLSNILPILNIDIAAIPLLNVEALRLVRTVLAEFFYFVLLIAIAHQLAKSYGISQTAVIFQSIAIYIATEALAHAHGGLDAVLSANSPFLVLIIPFLVVQAIGYLTPAAGEISYRYVGAELNTSVRNIYSGIINFALLVSLLLALEVLLELITAASGTFRPSLPGEAVLLFRTLLVGYLFWFGLHGTHIYDALFGVDHYLYPLFPGLTLNQFYNIFVVYGGVGATLSLIIAILIGSKDQHAQRIARLALPFSLFNINEVLVYGLPIVFNRKLLLPFLLVPLVNSILAYAFLSVFKIPMTDIDISWITPLFINSYLLTEGSLAALALQALLLGLGALIYLPFIRGYTLEQSGSDQSTRLSEELNVPILPKSEQDTETQEDYSGEKTVLFKLKSGQGIEAQKTQRSMIQDNEDTDKAINLLETATLMVYYQPKVNIRQGVCRQFEALLRIRMPDGEVKGPFFLPPLEKAGLEPIIDLWVCQQVNTHLRAWKTTPLPEISINLHPDTLARSDVIEKIIAIHRGNPIGFEVIERGLLDNVQSFENIQKLKANGFKILIDDFGTGTSSMENLCHIPVDTLKIDKSLADLILTKKGYIVCKNIVTLCQDMNLDCVIEGIESEAQMQAAARLGIPLIQGFFFSQAIAKNEAENLRQPRRYDIKPSK